ncbi:transcription elongation factor GreA [Candidatus Dojkabacteria bacterium]|uniref:Transcription elongation factor GreA n=1 Tax=Candidatus Dojkabacteria bacterium TaxID=2099670 RepID=A0A955L0N9_9BACT|nr:transcription elongation factor GreA [Candidatus Dojkabacteria bacterium]
MAKRKTTKTQEPEILIVTQEGYDDMVRELAQRKDVLRAEIAKEISVARDLGDLSENQAYTDAMEKKEMNENRIDKLDYLLSIAQVGTTNANDDIVRIGSTVEIEKVGAGAKGKKIITLVGKEETQEADSQAGKISVDSPVGKAVNAARIGDTVTVQLPQANVQYKILRKVAA